MPDEIQGVKFSEFPIATPGNADEVVGLHSGNNARFSVANFILAVRQGLANIFVPKTDVGAANGVASLGNDGKVPTSQLPTIPDSADEISYDNTSSGLTATDVQDAIDEVLGDIPAVPSISTATPQMDGTAAAGSTGDVSDAGHVHPSDTGKADLGLLAYVESGSTASKAYVVGEYFCWNGLLYRAKTAIASGASFTVGTNCFLVSDGASNDLEFYRPGESFTITGCYLGVSAYGNPPPVRIYPKTNKKIKASSVTFSGSITWIRSGGTSVNSGTVTSVTVTNEELLELNIAPGAAVPAISVFGVYITGTITLPS
jgi:hypothetical protein